MSIWRQLTDRITGAQPREVLRSTLGQGIAPVMAGVALGLICAIPLTRLIADLLYGVNQSDALTFIAVRALLGLVALVAPYIPARRASRVDPMVALRH